MSSLSVVIATAGRPDALKSTLRSLNTVELPVGWTAELILVESGVQSGANEQVARLPLRGFALKYLFEPGRGKSRALNLALAHTSGEILLFSDDDIRFPSNWVERMCVPILAGRADAVAGGVKLAPHLLRPWMNHTHRAMLASTTDYLDADDPSEMCGANMAVSRRVFDVVGPFDPELGPGVTAGGEESLLTWKIREAGFRVVGALHVEVEHHPSPDRLLYHNWVKAAELKGQARAYLLHHWFARQVHFPRLVRFYLRAKLGLRRALTGRRKPAEEGIAPWELSYLEEISMLTRYLHERRRPRNHVRGATSKLNVGTAAVTV